MALSFAGEQRQYVDEVARNLQARGVSVFYDRFERLEIWGKNGAEALHEVFSRHAAYVVMFISEDYVSKPWPQLERRSALSRMLQEDRVLPVRFDDTPVPGLPDSTFYERAKNYTPAGLAAFIVQKLSIGDFQDKTFDVPPPSSRTFTVSTGGHGQQEAPSPTCGVDGHPSKPATVSPHLPIERAMAVPETVSPDGGPEVTAPPSPAPPSPAPPSPAPPSPPPPVPTDDGAVNSDPSEWELFVLAADEDEPAGSGLRRGRPVTSTNDGGCVVGDEVVIPCPPNWHPPDVSIVLPAPALGEEQLSQWWADVGAGWFVEQLRNQCRDWLRQNWTGDLTQDEQAFTLDSFPYPRGRFVLDGELLKVFQEEWQAAKYQQQPSP